jgi:hypothetical protein
LGGGYPFGPGCPGAVSPVLFTLLVSTEDFVFGVESEFPLQLRKMIASAIIIFFIF